MRAAIGPTAATTLARPASTNGAVLQRKCACGGETHEGGECESCRKRRDAAAIQRSPSSTGDLGSVPPIVHDVLSESGQPLGASTRAFMEPRFGRDFSGVRVHTDARAAKSAHAVNALAYTVGQHIVFGSGQAAPDALGARGLLAHELTHVVQQTSDLSHARPGVTSSTMLEAEAEHTARAVANGQSRAVGLGSPTRLARQSAPEPTSAGAQPPKAPPFFGLPAAPNAARGIELYYNVTALPHTDKVDTSMLIKRRPYIIAPNLVKNGEESYSIAFYLAYRNEPGLLGPTGWNEYLIGPDSIEAFLANLDAYASGGAIGYMFGPPAPNAIEGAKFANNMLAGEFGAAARAYGRSLLESVKDPGWWVQMLTATASLARAPVGGPRVPTPGGAAIPEIPITPSPPRLTVIKGGGGSVIPVVGKVVYVTEGGAVAVRTAPVPAAPPPPLRLVPPPAPAAVPAPVTPAVPAPVGPFIPPAVAALVTGAIGAGTRVGASPSTAPEPAPQPDPERGRRPAKPYPICWATQLGPPMAALFVRTKSERDEDEAKQARMALDWRNYRDPDFNPSKYHVHHIVPLFLGGPDDLKTNGTTIPKSLHLKGHRVLQIQPQMLHPPAPLPPLPADMYKHPVGTPYQFVGFKSEVDDPCGT